MELAPGIHWVERVNANVYACLADDGVTLIDTGLPGIDRVDIIFNYLERLQKYPADVRRVLLTHADSDHAGNLQRIAAETGAEIFTPRASLPFLAAGRLPTRRRNLIQRMMVRVSRYPPVPAERVTPLEEGDYTLPFLGELQVISSPGHTPDHVSFYHPATGVLFAGDALNTRRGRLQCSPAIISANLDQAVSSALRLLQLTPAVFACGHGRPLGDQQAETLLALQADWTSKLSPS